MAYPKVPRVSFRCRSTPGDKVSVTCQGDGVGRVYVSVYNEGNVFADVSLPPKVARALAAELCRQATIIESGI